jgi:hypothetical protein
MPTPWRCGICLCVITCLLVACGAVGLPAQIAVKEKHQVNNDVRCVIRTEQRQWNRNGETVVSGTIENLTDGPLDLEVEPALYLSSRTSTEMGNKFWAPVDVLHDCPIGTDRHSLGANGAGVSIKARPIHLQFKNKDDKIEFRIDAQHLLWAKEISSVWPSSAFFSTVKSDVYDLQLVLETRNAVAESPKVTISIDATKPAKP